MATSSSHLVTSIQSSTASSLASTATSASPPSAPSADGSSNSNPPPVHNASVLNYYFLFLFVLALVIAALVLWLHRRKLERKQRLRQGGQHALARDLEGWAGARRFMHGRYRPYQASARLRPEEGLNEHGEAPPPYEPKNQVTVGSVQGSGTEVALPLQALTRDGHTRAPPDYSHENRPNILPGG
ncbi:hypothetical protein ACEQ8H_005728 [Pleosporales sp. CAS-2024a]